MNASPEIMKLAEEAANRPTDFLKDRTHGEVTRDLRMLAREVLAQGQEARREPCSYVLVPREPTLGQLRAYCGALENPSAAAKEMHHHAKARKRYRAMIDAAPLPAAPVKEGSI